MNKQEIFDKICKHLLTQKKQAYDQEMETCRYLTDNGLKCAVGCLIPDGHDAQHSNKHAEAMLQEYQDIATMHSINPFDSKEIEFLMDIQLLHDSTFPEKWESELRKFAFERDLKFNGV